LASAVRLHEPAAFPVPIALPEVDQAAALTPLSNTNSVVRINRNVAAVMLALYLVFLGYRSGRLFRAWQRTRRIKRSARLVEPSEDLQRIMAECQTAFQIAPVSLLSSDAVLVPITVGVWKPLVILPEELLREADADLLASAIGHEIVHVWRRDYLLNLIYEFLYLPLSFHPAAAFVRRRINQTRELCCDELVADRLIKADVYARSLVRLAGSAPSLGNLAPTTTVGIADADILEVRIMSLLNRSETSGRGKKLLLIAVALILAAPCVAAAAFTFRFDLNPDVSLTQQQENAQKAREREEKERAESEEYKKGLQLGQEEKERREKAAREGNQGGAMIAQGEPQERSRREQTELEMKAKRQAALAGLAKISMDQAIQIALSQQGGKVLECTLIGEHWEAPGKLAKDGQVLYHVVIFSGDEANPVTTHVLINAIDGTVFRSQRERAAIFGGKLNDKVLNLPRPEYPEIARAASASGTVAVEVTIDESGNVISAKAISGHPLLQAAAVSAARGAQFSPTKLNGEPVKVKGILSYDFVIK
jgi:TonB family protein